MLYLDRPFEVFVNQEDEADQYGSADQNHCKSFIPELDSRNRHSDRHAADKQQNRVSGPHGKVQFLGGHVKRNLVVEPDHGIYDEQASKKKKFGEYEQPHPDFRGSGIKMFCVCCWL